MAYDFSNLTAGQKCLLTFNGWQPGSIVTRQPNARTAKKMTERGLLVEVKKQRAGMSWSEFYVPLDVHMAWCDHCSVTHKG